VFEIVAIFAAFTMGLGTFLTKDITTQISFLKTLGPLFLLNCFFTLPIALVQRDWIVFEPKILALHVSAAIASIIAGYFIFVIIVRSSASISSISSTLSPALAAGFVSVNVAVLGAEGVNISETFIVRQVLAGLFYIVIFPPRGLTKSDLLKLMQRASLISVGSIASVYALQGGEIILMVSILATVTLWVLVFESIASKSIPDRSTIIAAVLAVAGIVSLRFVS